MEPEKPSIDLYSSEKFYTIARLLRRRQIGDLYRLDVNATIAATVRMLGYPSFQYKPDTKMPEYLVLIDRASSRDHQAHLFDNLSKALELEGIYIARYFFEGDPRICIDEKGNYVELVELQHKHAGDRLLIFGTCEKLIDPQTGRIQPWATLFSEWYERVVLTPEVSSPLALREMALATQFLVMPATLGGLLELVSYFESPVSGNSRVWLEYDLKAPPRNFDQSAPVIIEQLLDYLGEGAFQWL